MHNVQSISYYVEERRNTFQKSGKEFALNVRINEGRAWTIKTFLKPPADATIKDVLEIVKRSIELWEITRPKNPDYSFRIEGH